MYDLLRPWGWSSTQGRVWLRSPKRGAEKDSGTWGVEILFAREGGGKRRDKGTNLLLTQNRGGVEKGSGWFYDDD